MCEFVSVSARACVCRSRADFRLRCVVEFGEGEEKIRRMLGGGAVRARV